MTRVNIGRRTKQGLVLCESNRLRYRTVSVLLISLSGIGPPQAQVRSQPQRTFVFSIFCTAPMVGSQVEPMTSVREAMSPSLQKRGVAGYSHATIQSEVGLMYRNVRSLDFDANCPFFWTTKTPILGSSNLVDN